MSFPFCRQLESMDCGAAYLRMIAKHYGKIYSSATLRERCYVRREGVSMTGISTAAESIGFRTLGVQTSWDKLVKDVPLPCIAHWNQNHYIVIYNGSRLVK